MKSTLCAALLAFSALAANAQTPATQAPTAAPPSQAAAAAATARPTDPSAAASTGAGANASATTGFRAGMAVKDAQGAPIGSIARVIKTPDGATTYSVTVDGRNVNLPGSALTLSPSGGEAVSTMSKAQITASTNPPT